MLFCITLKGLNYFIDKIFNNQAQVLVWQRASTGAQTYYLLWALKLLGDFNHWLLCANCKHSSLQQGWESKGQTETHVPTPIFSDLQKPTCRQRPPGTNVPSWNTLPK